MNNLRLIKLNFILTFKQETYLPGFIGNTIRGAIGQALYDNYPDTFNCVFKITAAETIPNPIVISVPYPTKHLHLPDELLTFSIVLMGKACVFKQSIIDAATLMCHGKLKNTALIACHQEYDSTWEDTHVNQIPPCNNLKVTFLTPTEILASKKFKDELNFNTFVDRIFLRISKIIDNYSDNEFIIPYNLVLSKPHIITTSNLTVTKFQTSNQPITGFLGKIEFSGDVTRFLPYVDLASQIHIGKKTTRGCGQFKFEVSNFSEDE